jgi:antitoxin component of MazEF toxin-antitoxin module
MAYYPETNIMETEATIRRQGNSVGVNIPSPILRHLGFTVGQTVSLQATAEGLLITAKRSKRYTAAELNAQCDPKAPMPSDLEAWDNMCDVGSER